MTKVIRLLENILEESSNGVGCILMCRAFPWVQYDPIDQLGVFPGSMRLPQREC